MPGLQSGEGKCQLVRAWRRLILTIVYVRTAIQNPVLALTASATLRHNKPRRQGSSNDASSTHSTVTTQTEDFDMEDTEDECDMAKMEEIDLLGGLVEGKSSRVR